MPFDVENEMLVVAILGHVYEAPAVDRLVAGATAIATRLASEGSQVDGKEIRA